MIKHNFNQSDVLNCRLICKRWKYGVDHFLEDNPISCPVSGDDPTGKIERCHTELKKYIIDGSLLYKKFTPNDLEKLLVDAANRMTNPIPGRFVNITFSTQDTSKLNDRFLETFGRHIYFLQIDFGGTFDPLIAIAKLIHFLKLVPNLKGLIVKKRHLNLDDLLVGLKYYDDDYLEKFYNDLMSSELVKTGLPKLETLDLKIEGSNDDFLKKVFITMLKSDYLKSLTVNELLLDIKLEIISLVNLNLKIGITEELKCILNLKCPNVRKLELDLTRCKINFDILLQVLQKFQATLNHLQLGVPDEEEIIKGGVVEHKRMIQFFKKNGTLQMPNIKTISFTGYRPPSLNFICGKGFGTLEYLHIIVDRQSYGPLREYSKKVQRMDVIKRLSRMWSDWIAGSIPEMHSSNVWTMFPKLKVFKVSRYRHTYVVDKSKDIY